MSFWMVPQNNLAEITAIVGLVYILLEIWVLGLSTILLFASGVSTIATAFLIYTGLLPASLTTVFIFSGVGAGILTCILWTPLKLMQVNESRDYNIYNEFIGLKFLLTSKFDETHPVALRYSGVSWLLVLAPGHAKSVVDIGDTVKVIGVEAGQFIVVPDKRSNQVRNVKMNAKFNMAK